MATLPRQPPAPRASESLIVCGDDTLAHRLAAELRGVYGERVTLVVPETTPQPITAPGAARTRASIMLGRLSAAVYRAAGHAAEPASPAPSGDDTEARVLETTELTDEALMGAGVAEATALALVYDDDETNIRAALAARRINPRLRLVIRLYNPRLGQHLTHLLDQAALLAGSAPEPTPASGTPVRLGGTPVDGLPHSGPVPVVGGPSLATAHLDSSTTVLYDADTAAPALAAAAVAGSTKVVGAGGLLLRAVEVGPGAAGQHATRGLCTLALLSATASDPAGAEGSDESGVDAPELLPGTEAVERAPGRGRIVLETVSYSGPVLPPRRPFALGHVLSRRLRWSFTTVVVLVVALAVASVLTTGDSPMHAVYLTLLDLFGINDPATYEPHSRQVLQLLSGFLGLLLLPVLLAGVLEALGTFRSGAVVRRPPRRLSGHVVLLGLGKIGSRVLVQLRELNIPVVCVETDQNARGIAVARRLRVPVVLGDVTEDGVLEAAKIRRANSLLALTSVDSTNLEAALYARSLRPDLRVVLRLYDDWFAAAVYRTLRAAHPGAVTRIRSVSQLAAPAFAAAMVGRQILGAVPVERRVLLFAAVDVAGHSQLEGRTVAEAFRPGHWRIVALGGEPARDGTPGAPILVSELSAGHVLGAGDRVILAATRRGIAEFVGRGPGRDVPEPRAE